MTRAALCLLLLCASAPLAIAAPWDGPRRADTADGDVPTYVVPRAFTVTWEPGVEDVTTDAARRFTGPDELVVDGVRLERIGRIGAPRMHTDEYRAERRVDPGAMARALADRDDVRVAAPLLRLDPHPDAPWRAVTSDVLVMLVDPAADARLAEFADTLGLDPVGLRPGAPGQWRLRMRADAPTDPLEAATALREQAWTRWAQVDWIQAREERYTPSDDRFGDQWHLNNTGQAGGTPGHDVGATEAWDLSRGAPEVVVAILDSGVQLDHEDLEESLLPGYDFVDNDDDPSPSGSHGTSVAGAAAAPENGIGVVGVCALCTILPVRVIGASDSGEADAHVFAVDNGAWVINNSWGPPDGGGNTVPMSSAMETALEYVLSSGRGGLGTPIFWAAGNGHPSDTCTMDGFASHDDVIAVGASNNQGLRSSYSETCPELDLSSPSTGGSAGITTTRTGDGYTGGFGGTSAAAPIAAGVGAVVLHALPELTASQLQALLEATADKIDTIGGAWDENGHSIHYGWGRVNAAAALQSELAFLDVPTTLASCTAELTATVSIPNQSGGTAEVTAWSDTEAEAETFVLTEGAPGVYTGVVTLSAGPVVAGDGLVSARDGDSVTIGSEDSGTTRSVSLDCRPPEISSITVDEVTSDGARIKWVTDELSDGRATWGEADTDTGYNSNAELLHQIRALNLEPCTTYRVDLESADALGNVGRRNNAVSFETEGDRSVVPATAPEGADPCDPTTWTDEPPEPTPPIQQVVNPGDGEECSGCSVQRSGGTWGALLLLVALGRRRR